MKMNKYILKYYYSFGEVIKYLGLIPSSYNKPYQYETTYTVDSSHNVIVHFPNLSMLYRTSLKELYDYELTIPNGTPHLLFKKYVDCSEDVSLGEHSDIHGIKGDELLFLIYNRYYDEYIFSSEKNYENEADKSELQELFKKFMSKFMNILQFTYPKYSVLLKGYEDEENKLLGMLKRNSHIEGSGTGTSKRRDNDTPQDSGTFEDNLHTSFFTQGDDSNEMESDTTEEWDNEPLMDRLKRIQDSYKSIMLDWVNEFEILFIEGGNIHEI